MVEQVKPAVLQLNEDSEILLGDSLTRRALRHLRQDKVTLGAMFVLAVLMLLAFFAPLVTAALDVNPETTNPSQRLLPPGSPGHPFGTDDLGRDYFARLLYGGRISLAIGVSGTILTFAVGLMFGMVMGYYGGKIDDVLNGIITTLDSIPSLYLLILLSSLLHPGPEIFVILLALVGWTGTTRLIRGQTIGIRHLDYILSAQAAGANGRQILITHIMPNLLSITLISLAGGIAGLILAESTLSFLGLGVQPPIPTWGNMLTNAEQFFSNGPHLAIISGLLIFIVVLCLYVVGDGLRDAFDPNLIR